MTTSNHTPLGELSYYGLSLLSYLRDNFPDRADDTNFIEERADSAAEVYSRAVKDGHNHVEAEELASEELYHGLHFSPFSILKNILWREFPEEIPEEEVHEIALQALPECADIIAQYALSDDFEGTPEYDQFYTELVGTIQILLENGKL